MTAKRFTKGDWTNCRYDICEILKENEYFCTVATNDVDLIIEIFEEKDQLTNKLEVLEYSFERVRNKNKRLHKEYDKLWDLLKEKGMTEEEIIKELER